jgi:hypothetical protein
MRIERPLASVHHIAGTIVKTGTIRTFGFSWVEADDDPT